MAENLTTVTAENLRRAKWEWAGHLNLGSNGGQTSYRCPEFPEVAIVRGTERKAGRLQAFAVFLVRGPNGSDLEFDRAHIDLAAEAITKLRRREADDIEWNQAALSEGEG